MSAGPWSQEDISQSISTLNKKNENPPGGDQLNIEDFSIIHNTLQSEFEKVKNEFRAYWDERMTFGDRSNMIRVFNPYIAKQSRVPRDKSIVGAYYMMPEMNLEDLCKDSGERGSLFWMYEWAVTKEFEQFLQENIHHVLKMEREGTLAKKPSVRNLMWIPIKDKVMEVKNWKEVKSSDLWQGGYVTTVDVRNGVFQRLYFILSTLVSMIDEYRTEAEKDYRNRSLAVLMGCSICKARRCPDGAALKSCGGCHNSWYCSKTHQVQHWRSGHKGECKKMKSPYLN